MKSRCPTIVIIAVATALALAGCDQESGNGSSGGWFPIFLPWQQPAPVIINNPPPVRAPAPAIKPPAQIYKAPPVYRPPAPKSK